MAVIAGQSQQQPPLVIRAGRQDLIERRPVNKMPAPYSPPTESAKV